MEIGFRANCAKKGNGKFNTIIRSNENLQTAKKAQIFGTATGGPETDTIFNAEEKHQKDFLQKF
jgi:hypothetical protein